MYTRTPYHHDNELTLDAVAAVATLSIDSSPLSLGEEGAAAASIISPTTLGGDAHHPRMGMLDLPAFPAPLVGPWAFKASGLDVMVPAIDTSLVFGGLEASPLSPKPYVQLPHHVDGLSYPSMHYPLDEGHAYLASGAASAPALGESTPYAPTLLSGNGAHMLPGRTHSLPSKAVPTTLTASPFLAGPGFPRRNTTIHVSSPFASMHLSCMGAGPSGLRRASTGDDELRAAGRRNAELDAANKIYTCLECLPRQKHSYSTRAGLRYHYKHVHNMKCNVRPLREGRINYSFACEGCARRYTTSAGLRCHARTCTDVQSPDTSSQP